MISIMISIIGLIIAVAGAAVLVGGLEDGVLSWVVMGFLANLAGVLMFFGLSWSSIILLAIVLVWINRRKEK